MVLSPSKTAGNIQSFEYRSNHQLGLHKLLRNPAGKKIHKKQPLDSCYRQNQGQNSSLGSLLVEQAGKVILVNSVLAAMPVYQASILLAPKAIINQLDVLLRRFLWEGGKNGENKIHLVSWEKVKAPKIEGGLQIRDIPTQNVALGGKILWWIIDGKSGWSSTALRKKYFRGHKERCLDSAPSTRKGSPISTLCFKAQNLIFANTYWIPGNGKKINIWEDSILGKSLLGTRIEINNIRLWLQSQNVFKLWDISVWNQNETWKDWSLGDCPPHCSVEVDILLDALHGMDPISVSKKDRRGWGRNSGRYSVSEGYYSLKAVPWATPNPSSWRNLWKYPSLPKIDLFYWTLLHNSIFTWDNLKRRGREGPSRCPLYARHEETLDHLLLHCSFSLEV